MKLYQLPVQSVHFTRNICEATSATDIDVDGCTVTRFNFQRAVVTEITIPEISLNIQQISYLRFTNQDTILREIIAIYGFLDFLHRLVLSRVLVTIDGDFIG
jgi:hypothetical protein